MWSGVIWPSSQLSGKILENVFDTPSGTAVFSVDPRDTDHDAITYEIELKGSERQFQQRSQYSTRHTFR